MSSPPPAVLVSNGAVSPVVPSSAASFLESTPGAYTTARGLLWWPRHLLRLADSARLLAHSNPHLLGLPHPRRHLDLSIHSLVNPSVRIAVNEMRSRTPVTDLAVTALVRGGGSGDGLDVFVHAAEYAPPVFGEVGARVAVAGRGRDAAAAKYAPWARMRKSMERMRPPGVTELLLTNDGDHILEGSVTNFFVVCLKVNPNAVSLMTNIRVSFALMLGCLRFGNCAFMFLYYRMNIKGANLPLFRHWLRNLRFKQLL
ncbi:hypothetical protein PR202_gb16667 [Eleusine coracana subsp. coracana]|uniref:Uncharacterized protein n=1 Tax=Eleusine coracana subsp. coracana TaxID=191504 RepID=A0AAV5EYQ0_ELECO|nr:hypothetical protein PR202_gb16667 [Eleusine coracana subsp. coracana]